MKKVLFSLFIAVLSFCGGVLYGQNNLADRPSDYSDYNAVEMSWVIEGIQERISELQDELAMAQYEQRLKMME